MSDTAASPRSSTFSHGHLDRFSPDSAQSLDLPDGYTLKKTMTSGPSPVMVPCHGPLSWS